MQREGTKKHAEEQMRAVLHAWRQAVKVLTKQAKQTTKRQEEQEHRDKNNEFEQKQANSLETFHRLELARTKAQVSGKFCEKTGVTAEKLWKDTRFWENEILRLKEAACEDAPCSECGGNCVMIRRENLEGDGSCAIVIHVLLVWVQVFRHARLNSKHITLSL